MKTNVKTRQLLLTSLVLAVLSTLNLQLSTAFAQGSLTPPGAPGPTMKSLDQIEARTPISSVPCSITNAGSYYLTTNLTVSSGSAIAIATNGVTLDLNGFTISSTAPSAMGWGIYINNGLRNISILNGFVQGGVTNNGNGVYGGGGFNYGLGYAGVPIANVRVSGVSVSGCLNNGIYIGSGDATVVEFCTVRTVGGYGISASTVKSSTAVDCGNTAIYGDQVSDCRGQSTTSGTGIYAATVQNCYGFSGSGYGINANNAQNCYAISSSGTAIYVTQTAQGCYGQVGTGTGSGINAVNAQNCYGTAYNGVGISANTTENCYGNCTGSGGQGGIWAVTVQNSQGECTISSSGYGIHASETAIGCYGYSSSGTGLYARNASFCTGSRSGGTAIQATIANGCIAASGTNNITYKYNMP